MKRRIQQALDSAEQLEGLYRENPIVFARDFRAVTGPLLPSPLIRFWLSRLSHDHPLKEETKLKPPIFYMAFSVLLAFITPLFIHSFIRKGPDFYPSYTPFLIAFFLTLFLLFSRQKFEDLSAWPIALSFMIMIPIQETIIPLFPTSWQQVAWLHLQVLLLPLVALAWGVHFNRRASWVRFLYFCGQLLITSFLLIAGWIFLIRYLPALLEGNIPHLTRTLEEKLYGPGFIALPITGAFLSLWASDRIQQLGSLLSVIFTPLFLVFLTLFILYRGVQIQPHLSDIKTLHLDYLLFLVSLILLLYTSYQFDNHPFPQGIRLFQKSLIYLMPIYFLSSLFNLIQQFQMWTFSPVQAAHMGSVLLFILQYLWIAWQTFKRPFAPTGQHLLTKSIAPFIPIFLIWDILIVVLFPFLFK